MRNPRGWQIFFLLRARWYIFQVLEAKRQNQVPIKAVFLTFYHVKPGLSKQAVGCTQSRGCGMLTPILTQSDIKRGKGRREGGEGGMAACLLLLPATSIPRRTSVLGQWAHPRVPGAARTSTSCFMGRAHPLLQGHLPGDV